MTPRSHFFTSIFALAAMSTVALPVRAQTTAADYFKQGNQHFNNAEWDQAIASFQNALKLDPNYSDAQLVLALAYLLDGKLELARAGAIKYESMKPADPGGYVAHSQAASGLSKYAEAVQAAQVAIRLKPDRSNLAAAYFQLGYNEYMLGKRQEADQIYQTLKTIDLDSAQSLYKAIQRLEAEKKSKAAPPSTPPKAALDKSASQTASEYFAEGNAQFDQKNYAAAISSFKAAISTDPSLTAAYYPLGLSYYETNDPENAANSFKLYLKQNPNDSKVYVLFGISLKDVGDNSGAVDAFQKAINLKPIQSYLVSAYYNMGVAYTNAHQLPEAMRTYTVLRTISATDAHELLDYVRENDPSLKEVDSASGSSGPASNSTRSAPGPTTAKRTAPSQPSSKPSTSAITAAFPDLPDLPAARTAIQTADLIPAEKLTLTDVIFVLQYRDASTANQAAAKKVWSEVLAKEQNGEPLRISNALVISSAKSAVDLALSDDYKHAKKADTHLVLTKPLSAPAHAGLITNISGVITGYKTDPFVLTIERGQILSATSAASANPLPSGSGRAPQAVPAPPAAAVSAAAASKPGTSGENWFTYQNSGGNFSALLPAEPTDKQNPADGEVISHTIQALSKKIAYTVIYAVTDSDQTVDQTNFTVFRDTFMKSLSTCSIAAEAAVSPAVQGFIGRAYRLDCVISNQRMTMVGNLYWGRHYGYAVLAMFAGTVSDPPTARTFIDSFTLLDPTR